MRNMLSNTFFEVFTPFCQGENAGNEKYYEYGSNVSVLIKR